MYAAIKTDGADKDAKVQQPQKPPVNIPAKASPHQNTQGEKGAATVAGDTDKKDDGNTAGKKSTKFKKKKKKRQSSTSSDSETSDDDDDDDRAKSKKKATAGVTTRINIFSGAEGPPGVGVQSGAVGPNLVSAVTPPHMPFLQQMPMIPMMSMFEPKAMKTGVTKRPKKKDQSKRSSSEPPQAAAVKPTAPAGLVSGPEGQDVLIIPLPKGMTLPQLGNLNDLLSQCPEAKSKKPNEDNSSPTTTGAPAHARSWAPPLERGPPRAAPGMPEEAAAAKSALARRGSLGAAEAAAGEEDAGRKDESGGLDLTPTDQLDFQMSPHRQGDYYKNVVPEETDSNVLAFVIIVAVVIVIVVVVIVFIVISNNTSKSPTASPRLAEMAQRRRRVVRRHPKPTWNFTRLLQRFKHPAESYWNVQ